MPDTILFALVMYSVGCFVPTPLDEQQQPADYGPTFVSATPSFGILQHATTDAWTWQVQANDLDKTDDLTTRLVLCDPSRNNICTFLVDIPMLLMPQADPGTKLYRSGETTPRQWCFQSAPNKTYIVNAVVTDRGFALADSQSTMTNGGMQDTNHWELQCD